MKKMIYMIMMLFLIALITDSAFAQEKQKSAKETSPVKTETAKTLNTVCPVSGEEADAQITYEYNGKTYSLCCNTCLKKFKKDPEKYISRLSEDGKSLKSAKDKK